METLRKLFFAAFMAFGLWALCGSAWAVDDMVSRWKFDEGGGITAYDSAGDNDGTIYGSQWTTGQIDGALDFDGIDDYVEIPVSGDFDFGTGDFSISVWFKTSDSAREQYIIDFYGSSNTPHIEIYTSYGNLGTHLLPGDKRIRNGSVADGEWHHGAITLDNGASYGYLLYLDGVNVGRTSYSGFLANWETISIATRYLGYVNKPFDGEIDDVRIYDRALSAAEIMELYVPADSGPIAHWKFDEGGGATAYDSAGTHDGIVNGATWATGRFGGALDFDGIDDYVEILDSDDFDFGTGDFSISVWFKTSVSARDQYIIDFYGPGNTPHIEIYTSYGNLGTHILPNNKRINDGRVADGEWHHGAITLDNGASKGYRLYLDGVNVGMTSYSGFLANWETISVATRYLGYANKPFDGKIDEVRIYDRALSAEEIWDIYVWYPTELRAIDIKPGSCPNPLNVKSRGLLPVAVLGSEDFDVNSIDVASIRLAGVAPIRSSYEDVATPVSDANECECSTEGPDGFLDLTLKFEAQMIVEAIDEVNHGDELALGLTGVLSDETYIEGSDCIIIHGKHKPINKADFNGDGTVDMADFAAFSENWLQSSIVEY